MARRKLYHDGRKNICIVGFCFFLYRNTGCHIEGLCPMESRRMLLCRSIALALLGQNMDQDAVFAPLRLADDPNQSVDIVSIHRP